MTKIIADANELLANAHIAVAIIIAVGIVAIFVWAYDLRSPRKPPR